MAIATPTPVRPRGSSTEAWAFVDCLCGRHLGRSVEPVQVSVAPPSSARAIAVWCRFCKREVFLTVR